MNRKDFLLAVVKEAGRSYFDFVDQIKVSEKKKERPPGANPIENAFLEACTGCDRCMAACPVNIIMIEDQLKRDPVIYPEESSCIHCHDYPCIQSCPTGALSKEFPLTLRLIN